MSCFIFTLCKIPFPHVNSNKVEYIIWSVLTGDVFTRLN